jgi:ClpP class serine protease
VSGGRLIALAADEIVMYENAVLGLVDPQLGEYPAASILKAAHQKPIDTGPLFQIPSRSRPKRKAQK